MTRFEGFDSRGYRTVDVRSGYAEWVATYEQTVEDAMDIHLLEALGEVPWEGVHRAADLGCGTGRTGAWLRERGIATIDGVDLTPEMLDVARAREVYRQLVEADVSTTGLDSGGYDLVVTCLVDEHLADLRPLYVPTASTSSSASTRTSSWRRGCRPTTTAPLASRSRSRPTSTSSASTSVPAWRRNVRVRLVRRAITWRSRTARRR